MYKDMQFGIALLRREICILQSVLSANWFKWLAYDWRLISGEFWWFITCSKYAHMQISCKYHILDMAFISFFIVTYLFSMSFVRCQANGPGKPIGCSEVPLDARESQVRQKEHLGPQKITSVCPVKWEWIKNQGIRQFGPFIYFYMTFTYNWKNGKIDIDIAIIFGSQSNISIFYVSNLYTIHTIISLYIVLTARIRWWYVKSPWLSPIRLVKYGQMQEADHVTPSEGQ